MSKLTTLEYSILKTASEGGVWISMVNAMEIEAAEKLEKQKYIEVVPKESSTSGTAFKATEKGRQALQEVELGKKVTV